MNTSHDPLGIPTPQLLFMQLKHHWKIVVAVLLGALSLSVAAAWMLVYPFWLERQAADTLRAAGASLKTTQGQPEWLGKLFGSEHFRHVVLTDLANLEITDECLDALDRLPKLQLLVVGGSSFSNDDLSRLRTLDSLRVLVLDSTLVTDDRLESFQWRMPDVSVYRSQRRAISTLRRLGGEIKTIQRGTAQLRELLGDEYFEDATWAFINNVSVTDRDLTDLRSLTALRWLAITGTDTGDSVLSYIRGLTELEEVDLRSTRVSDSALIYLRQLPKLRSLWLLGTHVTPAGLKRFKRDRPDVKVMY